MRNWNVRFEKLVNHLARLLVVRCSAVVFTFLIFSLTPKVFGVSPAPDGGYPGRITAEGTDALLSWTNPTLVAEDTAIGYEALYKNTSGTYDTAVGSLSLNNNVSGGNNTAIGAYAMIMNDTGGNNTATGTDALAGNTSANNNTANGSYTLSENTTGSNNTAIGGAALSFNKTGNNNTASGANALQDNTADNNTATGFEALLNNTSGAENTASGSQALLNNNTGGDNTATGIGSLFNNTSGGSNTANGAYALFSNKVGAFNTASGENALRNDTGSSNTAVGIQAMNNNTSGSNNTAIGALAGQNLTTGNNNIDIGANVLGNAGDANTIRIGKSGTQQKTFIAGIYGKTLASGVGIIINSSGQLGTMQSSARFKDEIQPMDKASEAVLKLKPVTFHYKEELDPEKIPQFGLIAEEVEKVNPDLVVRDQDGKAIMVRYEAVNAMLLNEFLKEHEKGQLEKQKIRDLETRVADQEKQIEALMAGMQKISAQAAINKSAPQVAAAER